jgi:glycosyltransferase involved in cell wall biosynthesis
MVFSPLYEGSGIPPLEVMRLGKPVLATRSSSLPEVTSDAGIFFDPLSSRNFSSALTEIANPGKLVELGPKAIKQSRTIGLARMAQPLVEWVRSWCRLNVSLDARSRSVCQMVP